MKYYLHILPLGIYWMDVLHNFGQALTWDILLPHLSPEGGIMAIFIALIRTRCLMHTEKGEWQSHSCMTLQHIRTIVADGMHGQCTWRLVRWLWDWPIKDELKLNGKAFKGNSGTFSTFFLQVPCVELQEKLLYTAIFCSLIAKTPHKKNDFKITFRINYAIQKKFMCNMYPNKVSQSKRILFLHYTAPVMDPIQQCTHQFTWKQQRSSVLNPVV